MKKFFFNWLGVLGSLFFLCAPGFAYALVLSPTLLDFEGTKGTATSQTIHLKNNAATPITVAPKIYAVLSQDEQGFPNQFAPLASDDPLKAWVSYGGADGITLAKNEEKDVPVTVSVPPSAAAGGYYATIAWRARNSDAHVALTKSPGVNIAITVPGEVKRKATLTEFSVEPQKELGLSLPLVLRVKVRNDGGIHFYPEGTIEVKNMFGSVVARIPVSAQKDFPPVRSNQKHPNGSVLPGVTRELYGTWGSAFAFGSYSATLTMDTQGGGTLSAHQSFFVASHVLTYLLYALLSLCIVGLLRFLFQIFRLLHLKK